MHIALSFLGTVAALIVTIRFVPGITLGGEWTNLALLALVWSAITLVVRPVLSLLTFPITLMTFGLFSFVLNAGLFYAMQWVIPAFTVAGPVPALLGALVLSAVSWVIHKVV